MAALTRRQRQIYEFIEGFINSKGCSPTFDEIRLNFNLNSLATVHGHIKSLGKRGVLTHRYNLPRSIEILPINGRFKRDLLKENQELRERVAELEERITVISNMLHVEGEISDETIGQIRKGIEAQRKSI